MGKGILEFKRVWFNGFGIVEDLVDEIVVFLLVVEVWGIVSLCKFIVEVFVNLVCEG